MPIGTVPPPSQHPDEEPLVCLEINEQWIPIILGALQPLKYPEYWGGTLEENRRARKDFGILLNQIMLEEDCDVAKECCEDVIYIHRIDPVTGRLQRSSDGGDTWTTDPTDPLNVITKIPPLITAGGSKTKCDAATNFQEHFNDVITASSENLGTATTIFELAAAVAAVIIDIIVAILTVGAGAVTVIAITDAIFAACAAAFAEGKTAFDAYWTSDKKDKVLCAAFCTIGDDGQFTDAQWNAFRAKVKVDLPAGAARDMVLTTVNAGGSIGASNMASYGAAALSDCGDCACNDFIRLFVSTGGGTQLDWDGEWLTCNGVAGGGHYTSFIQVSNPAGTFNPALCASIEIELISGTIDILDSAYAPCGAALGAFVPIGIAPFPGTSTVQLALRNFEDANFVIRVRGTLA